MIIFTTDTKERIVFHYNKAHNQDITIPQWVVKHRGITYYCNHLSSNVGFETKETPDSEHTKASIQFKGILTIVDDSRGRVAIIK